MEKRVPHYRLVDILDQMTDVQSLNLTLSAQTGMRALGMTGHDALD